ncbi:condensation domain-containing protein, partial [Streptomyces yangpuensis]|uniref:condensation domain-containing protein n=1 Tax=Streptomyces yangpuensis TaxID=1648182 RepID=UPI00381993C6
MQAQEARLPLTAAQHGLWSLQQLEPDNPFLVVGEFLDIRGAVDPYTFEAAVQQVVREAETLRVRVVVEDGDAFQIVMDDVHVSVPVVDLSSEPRAREVAEQKMRAMLTRPIDVTRELPFRFTLFKLSDEHYLHFHCFHHMVLDGWALGLVARRMAEVYTALATGRPCDASPFGPLRTLLTTDEAYQESAEQRASAEFWKQQLAGLPEPVRLSTGLPGIPGGVLRQALRLSDTASQRLRTLAQTIGVRGSSAALAAVSLYMQRVTGTEEIVLGLPVTARTERTVRTVPGMTSNVVPLRLRPESGASVAEVFRYVAEQTREVLPHQRYRYESLARDLKLIGTDRQLFGPNVNILGFDYNLTFGTAPASGCNLAAGPTQDLGIIVVDRDNGEGWQIDFEANADLYSADDIAGHLQRFVGFLETLAGSDPNSLVRELDILTQGERELLGVWNDTAVEVPVGTVGEVFGRQADTTPDAVAVIGGEEQISYAELEARANRLAHLLIEQGVGPERVVALSMPRGIDMITAVLGVLKAGGAYLPVDPT